MKVKFGILGCMTLVTSGPMADGTAWAKPAKAPEVSREPYDWEYVSGRWMVTGFPDFCELAYAIVNYDTFSLLSYKANHAILLSHKPWGNKVPPKSSWSLIVDGKSHMFTTARVGTDWGVTLAGPSDDGLLDDIAAGRKGLIRTKGKPDVAVDMRGSRKAVAAFRQCLATGTLPDNEPGTLVPLTGDPPPPPAPTASFRPSPIPTFTPRPATMTSEPFLRYSSPWLASRAGEIGKPTIRYTVGVDGLVKNCVLVEATTSVAIDSSVCPMVIERYRFDPARDAAGTKIESEVTETIYWEDRY